MAETSITKTGAIRISDIYSGLGVPQRTNGYDLAYICSNQHGKTNMWARYKPEAIGGPTPITDAQRKSNNYGLKPSAGLTQSYQPNMNELTGIPALLSVTWSYEAPTPTSHWSRLTDWAGYEFAAASPIAAAKDVEISLNSSSVTIDLTPKNINTVNSLTLADFDYCKDYYLGVVVWVETISTGEQSFVGYVTANSKISDTTSTSSTSVTISRNELPSISSGKEIHYAICFSETCKPALSTETIVTSLYPVVTSYTTEAVIDVAESAPATFTLTGVSTKATETPVADSLDRYGTISMGTDDSLQVTALGVGKNSGTIAFFGYFTSDTATKITITSLIGTMQPTITGTKGVVTAKLYVKNSSGSYIQQTSASVTVYANTPLYVALEFNNIAYVPSEGASWVLPSGTYYDTYCSSVFRCNYTAADTTSISAFLFSRQIFVWEGSGDKAFSLSLNAQT